MMSAKPKLTVAELTSRPPRFSPEERARLEAIDADAGADADDLNPTWTDDQLKRAVFARTLRALRESTGLSQAGFAKHYKINVGRLKDWEQARSRPDTVAEAYISVIRHNRAAVDAALHDEAVASSTNCASVSKGA